MAQSEEIEVGDKVEYEAIGGGHGGASNSTSTGIVTDILTETQEAGSTGSRVKASEDEPRFVIKNDNTGKETAYKGANIHKVVS